METSISPRLESAIEDLPRRFPGPGGAVAVMKDGVAIVRHTWGYSDLERRIPYTLATLAPICSITKQFTCAAVLGVCPDPSELDGTIAAQFPRLQGAPPTTLDLANNQSGLRDYWALTVLCGATPEGDFRPSDATTLLGLTRSLHFEPGTAYSYSNGNFRVLAAAVEQTASRPFGEFLMERVVRPAGMEGAVFAAETGELPGDAMGYDGTLAAGWRPGINRIHWTGDAGLCASMDDMIAWESFIDRTRNDPEGVYARLARPVAFKGGSPAGYGLGLVHTTFWGRAMSGHGGAIRGWRLQRFWVPSERLSVAIAFNHESDSRAAAVHVLAAALGESDAPAPSLAGLAEGFAGTWLDEKIGLLLDVKMNSDGTLSATYDGGAEILSVAADGVARGHDMTLARAGGAIRIDRPADAIYSLAVPVANQPAGDISGVYRSSEFGSEVEIVNANGSWFAGFKGFLGQGPMMPLLPAGRDLWRLVCNRSLDAPSPGDWTVRVLRSAGSKGGALSIGCWLARNVRFDRLD